MLASSSETLFIIGREVRGGFIIIWIQSYRSICKIVKERQIIIHSSYFKQNSGKIKSVDFGKDTFSQKVTKTKKKKFYK